MSVLIALGLALAHPASAPENADAPSVPQWSLVVHGGAGTILREKMSPQTEAEIRAALDAALALGAAHLAAGGSSLEAVEMVIRALEDDAHFNAGRGAVFTWEGTNSLDASIMRGDTLEAGAVAGLSESRHPISVARAVMEQSPHVLLSGDDAERFARAKGLERVDPSFFFTQWRYDALVRYKAQVEAEAADAVTQRAPDAKFGTVGAVARDSAGVISAGTSTGGMTGKRWGRIGDSPIIGAGTYATARCGVSATGHGEYFIRLGVAQRICTHFDADLPPPPASDLVAGPVTPQQWVDGVMKRVGQLGGSGGVVFIDPDGRPGWSFDTPGMYRGYATPEARRVAIFKDEE
ncbi:isoaspartyl peptidase/L-asparaginase family protein [Sphingomicrobium astaxanthinifaciens]|uniref:isoaspartyl peptidase/L-asparaginase family protein n=1 Tax=Sphingomicrobium astaxanthinifaciens TaxID=1227949 RepID=UPI001FCA8F44|nr:isoaspartyl peptidase/L-asparaginase [Sphingomicrobium astaxanthinifaciens]MCJ7421093.1 isoaspartyl peptidase/L-asparaginase [Sphingomicrobium astaxanthinifaciens]